MCVRERLFHALDSPLYFRRLSWRTVILRYLRRRIKIISLQSEQLMLSWHGSEMSVNTSDGKRKVFAS